MELRVIGSNNTYSYDANNRPIGATIKGPDGTQTFSRTYTYDIFGNLNAKSGGGLNATIGVDTSTNHPNAAGTTYDALGDVTTLHPPGSASTYALTYDPVGSSRAPSSTAARRRISTSTPPTTSASGLRHSVQQQQRARVREVDLHRPRPRRQRAPPLRADPD